VFAGCWPRRWHKVLVWLVPVCHLLALWAFLGHNFMGKGALPAKLLKRTTQQPFAVRPVGFCRSMRTIGVSKLVLIPLVIPAHHRRLKWRVGLLTSRKAKLCAVEKDKMIDVANRDIVNYLATQSVANVQNGLIHTLSIWLDIHIKGERAYERKNAAFQVFFNQVSDVVTQREYERKEWPSRQPLPNPYNKTEVIESISKRILPYISNMALEQGLTFLAKLWGGWILVCPRAIIQNSPEYSTVATTAKNEAEVYELMLRYLDFYGTM
jgi:hypothetical protein